jgi:hypothetical protein
MTNDFRWVVRVSWQAQARSTVYARNNSFSVERQASFKEADDQPAALEYLLGALGSDLIAGLVSELNRARIVLDALEISLAARLNNPLIFVGVIGEQTGHPGLETIEGKIYITAEADAAMLLKIWEATLARSPIFNTLQRCSGLTLNLELKPMLG